MATGKSLIKNFKKDKGYENIPRELLQHCDRKATDKKGNKHGDNGLSLQAIGLLVNLQSYPEDWELNKTELYKRYSKNKKSSVMSAWNELVNHKYIIQFLKREGKANQYIYYFNTTPFTEDEIRQAEELEGLKSKDSLSFRFSEAQNEKLKMRSSKSAPNRIHNEENTHKQNTHEKNTHEKSENSDKKIHLSHKLHSNKQIEYKYYTDGLPEMIQASLKNYDIKDIRTLKKLMYAAIKNVNKNYDSANININEVEIDFVNALKKIEYKIKKSYEEYFITETISTLEAFIFTTFRNVCIDFLDYNTNNIEAHTEPKTETGIKPNEKEMEAETPPKYASEDEEIKSLIDSFRNS